MRVFTRMPGESYFRWLMSLLYLCCLFRALINSLMCWLYRYCICWWGVPGGCKDASVCVVCWVRVSKSINLILFMWLSKTPLPMSMQVNSANSCTRSLTTFVRELGVYMEETSIRTEKDCHGLFGIHRAHGNDFVFHFVNVTACFESASWLWSSTCRVIQCLQWQLSTRTVPFPTRWPTISQTVSQTTWRER